jgi:hypothetical protein
MIRDRPVRQVVERDGRFLVLGVTEEMATTDEGLARRVAAEFDRIDPLQCSPQYALFFRTVECCGRLDARTEVPHEGPRRAL